MRRDIPASRLREIPNHAEGLSSREAELRQRRFGPNEIVEVATNPWFAWARDTVRDPMIWFLMGTGLIYGVLGSYTEAVTLLIAIVPLIGMDAFLHYRTQASTEGLNRQLAAKVRVVRDGTAQEIPATGLVPGDLTTVATGEPFPADGLIVGGDNIQVDESSLTGESYPVLKRSAAVPPGASDDIEGSVWIDGERWGFAGTRLLTGTATLRVIYTGRQTLYGEIVHAAVSGARELTPLQSAISRLVSLLVASAGVLCLVLAGVRLRQGHDWLDALVSAATLAVAALPEEFPVVFTVFLGVGAFRLARRKALVRRAVSVENIGRITCVCSDKTGTLTEGRLRLEHLIPVAETSGSELLCSAALASRQETGDPMDTAILARLDEEPSRPTVEAILATYPYTEQRRRETAVVRLAGRIAAVSKGAPEALLSLSSMDSDTRTLWSARVERLAAEGHKIIACLRWNLEDRWTGGEPDRGGEFVGLLAFEDPIRDGVAEAVRQCREAGIRVIMVTGDHPATAACVARDIGLIAQDEGLVLGDDLARSLENGDERALVDVRVVARAMPTQKLALVQALKASGEVVAVTGDGVNDVPALQAADIGIAMGERGTRSAREAASIVLMNDNFSTIVHSIAEGRQLFRNLQLSFQYILLIHIPLVVTATFIPLAGYPILYLPIHIVWLETLIHPTALLVFQELPTREALQPMPKRRSARFFSAGEWSLIAAIGTLLTALVLWSYDRSLLPGRNVEHARAMAMVVLTFASASATALLSGLRTQIAWLVTIATVGITILFVQHPWLATRLSLQPLHGDDWLIAMLGSILCVAGPVLLYRAIQSLIRLSLRLKGSRRAVSRARPARTGPAAVGDTASLPAPSLTYYAWLSIATALATILLKSAAYFLTGSVALFSDAAESLVNLAGAGFALIILKVAARPADENHPFGHGKAEYFSSGFEGALILVAASGILWTAGHRLIDPQPIAALDVGMWVSGIATGLNLIMARALLKAGHASGSIALEADGRHLMTDVWTTSAVLLGLGGMMLTGWLWLDAAIAVLAALHILGSGAQLILRSLSGLLGAAIPSEERRSIERILEPYREMGLQFHDLRARMTGTSRFITLHVLVPGGMTVQDGHNLLEQLESEIRRAIPNLHIVTHLEPLEDPSSFQHETIS